MKTRVYYGQYSLKHWINLMLKRNIVLPEYQRSFVWGKDDIDRLIKSFNDGQFVQPITIAQSLNKEGEVINIILDGQQRLTSILLYYLERFPKTKNFDKVTSSEENNTNVSNNKKKKRIRIKWRFEELLKKDKDDNDYETFNEIEPKGNEKDDFLNKHFLGFSYIVPSSNCNNPNDINSYYSTLFRKINYYGEALTPRECRSSLYYMNSEIKNYFEGKTNDNKNILCDIKTPGNNTNIDIIRYLSNLSLYYALKENKKEDEFKFYTKEEFYTDYVFHVLGQETEDYDFTKFNFETTLKNNWNNSYERICDFINNNSEYYNLENPSWNEIDFWLSGLIYWNLFKNKTIKEDNENLFKDIKAEIDRNKELRSVIDNFGKINFHEPLEQIYKEEGFKILKEIYEKELNNPMSDIFNLCSQREKLRKELSNHISIGAGKLQKEREFKDDMEEAKQLIKKINNDKQNNTIFTPDVLKSLLYIPKLIQDYTVLKENQNEEIIKINKDIMFLNFRINRNIFSIAKKEYEHTSSSEYIIKKSIEIYGRYVQE